MAETDDYSVTGESSVSHETRETGKASQAGSSETTGTSVLSVVTIKPQNGSIPRSADDLPELPSKRFQYSIWHDLRRTEITGPELKAPRVRDGPKEKEKTFYKLVDEDNNTIHHSMHGKEREKHRNQLENWEEAEFASLSYQELSHSYQRKNFERILERLKKVVHLNLMHNTITSLSSYSFPCCEYLNLNNNYIGSLKNLPSIPRIKYLMLVDNHISNLEGLKKLRSTSIEELYLIGNPVTFIPGYRQRVFEILTGLNVLDGIPKLDSDTLPEQDDSSASKNCVIT